MHVPTLPVDSPGGEWPSRRAFLAAAGLMPAFAAMSPGRRARAGGEEVPRRDRLLFTSRGKTALVNADGSGLRYFHFDKPGQATWQPGATFPDGRRVIVLSMEPRRDGPGRGAGSPSTPTAITSG